MRRGYWIVLLLLLAGLAGYLMLSRRSGSYRTGSHDFSIGQPELIRAIRMHRGNDTIRLLKAENGWLVNDTWPVRTEHLEGLLILLSRLEVKAPVSNQYRQAVLQALQEGTRVQVRMMDGTGKAYRLAYHEDTRSTYMLLDGSQQAFSMQVRGYDRRNLEEVFDLDAAYWRDNSIFHHLPEQIRSFSHVNHRQPERSFRLRRRGSGGSFMLARMDGRDDWQLPDPGALAQFLSYLGSVRFVEYHDPADSLRTPGEVPRHTLVLIDTAGRKTRLELFPAYLQRGQGNVKTDVHYLFGRLNDEPRQVLIKYLEIDLLLKDYGYFSGD